jgi:L-2-hydroxyglutarate oxidase LhgO
MTERIECAVIGAGVVGLAIARRLAAAGREVVILEAENAFGTHTSSRNSEVIHAGIYYPTDSLKARLCVAGRRALYRYCADHNVKHRRIGKIIVACDESELAGLAKYRQQAAANGVDDLRPLGHGELAALEPEVRCVAGLLSPSTGIVDSHGLMLEYLGDAESHGAALALGIPVVAGRVENDGITLETGGAKAMSAKCDIVVNSAGFNAQSVARSTAGVPAATIPPTHYAIGHYYVLMIQGPRDHGIRGLVNLFGIESPAHGSRDGALRADDRRAPLVP